MEQVFLSNIELYYFPNFDESNNLIYFDGEELYHAVKVMRNKNGDILYVTNGKGLIAETEIIETSNIKAVLRISKVYKYINPYPNITFYIPNLKNSDRLEFALEKCIELGITNLIIYNSDRAIGKGIKIDRLNKIAISAMKQSLHSYLPNISFNNSLINTKFITELIILDQESNTNFVNFFGKLDKNEKYTLLIGPEGGLSDRELLILNKGTKLNLAPNRLRSVTACITCASLLNFAIKVQ